MKATPGEVQKSLVLISGTSQRIEEVIKGCREEQLHLKAHAKAWSASDLLAHLRSCGDLWTHSIYAMLAEKEPVFSDIDERKWAKVTKYAELPFRASLQIFAGQRQNLVRVLEAIPFASWERSALSFERRHTVFTQTRRLAKHEAEHIEQLRTLLRV